ncbi:D-alanyl-D-alanine carboxypeptidase family protein [Paenibacillus filicis]|uniref:D-alanyl-D-alanine carboxypeptidase family protein n=1 Tax=Paenibacillus gyeongsangnamensis TaxID=3388067 RepID=A0ABT4QJT4_9BACL|nr:D-alanyl-D-alanine carboxypeptidase family protein [Paenibacillus filicis]MCZ8517142.1 D-alanyl-D-alanine carboxypeptidase family protein [Paenibacillus filicis]
MNSFRTPVTIVLTLAGMLTLLAGCGSTPPAKGSAGDAGATSPSAVQGSASAPSSQTTAPAQDPAKAGAGASGTGSAAGKPNAASGQGGAVQVVAKPDDIAVLVNKTYALPPNYKPADLVEPNIPFTFKEQSEKRMMRKEAAKALESLVAGAKKDGFSLAGVSAFRSESTQRVLFNNYAKADGEEAARKYSALPGHSEHETGLAIDLSGSDGKCQAQDCFGATKEADWLAKHASEYGFIIRYPKGKEDVTGYQYEPWHIRYVGVTLAKELTTKGLTLEEYLQNSVPVTK